MVASTCTSCHICAGSVMHLFLRRRRWCDSNVNQAKSPDSYGFVQEWWYSQVTCGFPMNNASYWMLSKYHHEELDKHIAMMAKHWRADEH